MATLATIFRSAERTTSDQRVVLRNVSWGSYEAFVHATADGSGVRTVYLDGELEIMSPSPLHEHLTTLIARLIEAYADHEELPLIGLGSATFRKKAKKAGLEPDECYVLGREKPFPDLAIEIALTSGHVDKVEAYRRLAVREVWFLVKKKLHVFRLGRGGVYSEVKRSALLPGLDIARIERILASTPIARQAEAVRSFRRSLTTRRRRG